MTSPTPTLLAARVGDTVCVKISGRANFATSVDFKQLVTEACARGAQRFIVDLAACPLMDSTFLGVLASLGMKLSADNLPPEQRPIELLNPSAKVADLIDSLGVLQLFRVVQGNRRRTCASLRLILPAPPNWTCPATAWRRIKSS